MATTSSSEPVKASQAPSEDSDPEVGRLPRRGLYRWENFISSLPEAQGLEYDRESSEVLESARQLSPGGLAGPETVEQLVSPRPIPTVTRNFSSRPVRQKQMSTKLAESLQMKCDRVKKNHDVAMPLVSTGPAPTMGSNTIEEQQVSGLAGRNDDAALTLASELSSATTASDATLEWQTSQLPDTESAVATDSVFSLPAARAASAATVSPSTSEPPVGEVDTADAAASAVTTKASRTTTAPSSSVPPAKPAAIRVCKVWLDSGDPCVPECGRRHVLRGLKTATDKVKFRQDALALLNLAEERTNYKKIIQDYPELIQVAERTGDMTARCSSLRGIVFDMLGGQKRKKAESPVSAPLFPTEASDAGLKQSARKTSSRKRKRAGITDASPSSSATPSDSAASSSSSSSMPSVNDESGMLLQELGARLLRDRQLNAEIRPHLQQVITRLASELDLSPLLRRRLNRLRLFEDALVYPVVATHLIDELKDAEKREMWEHDPKIARLRKACADHASSRKVTAAELEAWIKENDRSWQVTFSKVQSSTSKSYPRKQALLGTVDRMLADWQARYTDDAVPGERDASGRTTHDVQFAAACKNPALWEEIEAKEIRLYLEEFDDPLTSAFRKEEFAGVGAEQISAWITEHGDCSLLCDSGELPSEDNLTRIVQGMFKADAHLGKEVESKETLIEKVQTMLGFSSVEDALDEASMEAAVAEVAVDEVAKGEIELQPTAQQGRDAREAKTLSQELQDMKLLQTEPPSSQDFAVLIRERPVLPEASELGAQWREGNSRRSTEGVESGCGVLSQSESVESRNDTVSQPRPLAEPAMPTSESAGEVTVDAEASAKIRDFS